MAILDPTQPIGKMRLRVGDYSDLPLMPDEVYMSALADCNNNVPKASVLVATYILAMLTGQTHQKLAQIEVFGAEWYQNYLSFVKATILNPNFMDISPMPYVAQVTNELGQVVELPLVQFQKDWNNNYVSTTNSQDMHLMAMPPRTSLSDPFAILGGFNA
jgi:hypothetical protein